jgi:ATP-dependent helicase/nuclease subunit B
MNSTPRCHTISAVAPFAATLADWVTTHYGSDGVEFSRAVILLPNRRACQTLQAAFLERAGGKPMLLPRIQPIGDLNEEDAGFFAFADTGTELPNAVSPVKRHLLLTQLVMEYEKVRRGHMYHAEQAAELAARLATFLDEVDRERLTLDRLENLVPEELAAHWQQTLHFLKIISVHWPAILQSGNSMDAAKRRERLLSSIASYWRASPPDFPVIAAGSTGSQPATAELLATIAHLPQGSVILSGLDLHMPDEEWKQLQETHPQYGMKQLLAHLKVARNSVTHLENSTKINADTGLQLIFQPPQATTQWINLKLANTLFANLSLLTADTQLDEARMIAIALRETLETPGKTAALVTPDRALARMVIAQMRRFDIAVDDSAGTPLSETPAGSFLRLIANCVASAAAPVDLLALLRHPLSGAGYDTAECRELSRRLERELLRGVRHESGIEALCKATNIPTVKHWLSQIANQCRQFSEYFVQKKPVALSALLSAHIQFAEWLASTDREEGLTRLWQAEEGNALALHLNEIMTQADILQQIDPMNYPALFNVLLRTQVFRPKYGTHPRLHILSPMEARMQSFDRIILGELSEDVWPMHVTADPWMSKPMRAAFGLPSHERSIGQSALDVYILSHAPEVIWTRSRKIESSPSIPSRWWIRLETLVRNKAPDVFERMTIDTGFEQAKAMHDAPISVPPLSPPNPVPPLEARPSQLSVTAIDAWIRDPYIIYAKYILKLRPLEDLDQDPDAADFGIIVHRALEQFVKRYPHTVPDRAYEVLLECGKDAFSEFIDRPAVACLWWPRFASMAEWVIEQEILQRETASHVYSEVTGSWDFPVDSKPFTLTTRIDRLTIENDGRFSLADYKTGTIPDESDQLALEALIVQEGKLDIPVTANDSGIHAFWKLSGNASNCEIAPVESNLQEVRTRLEQLIRSYRNPMQGYGAQTDPTQKLRHNDYAHLTRRQEWESV